MHWYTAMSLSPSRTNKTLTKGKKLSVKMNQKSGWAYKKCRYKSGIKTQEDYLTAENCGEERLKDYFTSVA